MARITSNIAKVTSNIAKNTSKKCIPGVICVENMTLFLLVIILLILCYIFYAQYVKPSTLSPATNTTYIVLPTPPLNTSSGVPLANNEPLTDLFAPPLKNDMYFRKDSGDIRGIPVNVQTRSVNDTYKQVGILTRMNGGTGEMILPLMGKQLTSGTYKWQYYTMSATGNLNTKLPISLNGKSCTGEYGCENISNGDVVYVEGYNDTFKVTLYENSSFNYIPFL